MEEEGKRKPVAPGDYPLVLRSFSLCPLRNYAARCGATLALIKCPEGYIL